MIQKSPSHDTVPGDEHTRPEFARAALLTIDMQADFISGPHAVPGTEQIVPAAARLARAFRDAGLPIVHLVRLYSPTAATPTAAAGRSSPPAPAWSPPTRRGLAWLTA